jgi:alpha-N-acetylglucosaminidase
VLYTDTRFMLGPWLVAARARAGDDAEATSFEEQFRNQLTLWGPNGEILDYARKQWAGIIEPYYKQRWLLFESHVLSAVMSGGIEKFNQTLYEQNVCHSGKKWIIRPN